MRIGAIDIGSNSIRLLVADVGHQDGGSLFTIARAGEACRLGRGVDRTGRIEGDIAEKAGSIAAQFIARARGLGAVRLIAAGTAALRTAANGAEVAQEIGARCGVPVRILSGNEEARLVYQAVSMGLGQATRGNSCVVFDLGGGSTEVVSGVGSRPGRWASLAAGAVTLTEKHVSGDPAGAEELAAIESELDQLLMHQCALMPQAAAVLAGVGGTVTALASLDRGLAAYQPDLIEGWLIGTDRLEKLIERVVGSTEAERREWNSLGRGRSDIVTAGAVVVRLLARRFRSQGLVCSTQGLRYGLARLAITDEFAPQ